MHLCIQASNSNLYSRFRVKASRVKDWPNQSKPDSSCTSETDPNLGSTAVLHGPETGEAAKELQQEAASSGGNWAMQ